MSVRRRSLHAFDRTFYREGYRLLAGLDEAGRGSLAGPVVAACVVLEEDARLAGVADSKELTPAARAEARAAILGRARAVSWAFVGPRAIDALNIRRASLLAMRRALARALVRTARGAVPRDPRSGTLVLVDGIDEVETGGLPQRTLIEGDGRSLAIAAASVVAKTTRDAFMERLAREHPAYGFERHKGYGTPDHLAALEHRGPCRWHRFSYAPVAQVSLFASATAPDAEA